MKTIITGPRDFKDYQTVKRAVAASGFTVTEVVSGCAPGADMLGQRWAVEHLTPLKRFPAGSKGPRVSAEAVRNRQMSEYATALVAVWDGTEDLTADMIRRAKDRGLKVHVETLAPKPVVSVPPPPPLPEPGKPNSTLGTLAAFLAIIIGVPLMAYAALFLWAIIRFHGF